MKKIIWALIALIPFSTFAGQKWLYGHGPSEHQQVYSDTFSQPEPDPAEYRDPASAPGTEKDYDSKTEESDPRDTVYDRSSNPANSYSEDAADWDQDATDRPSGWDL